MFSTNIICCTSQVDAIENQLYLTMFEKEEKYNFLSLMNKKLFKD